MSAGPAPTHLCRACGNTVFPERSTKVNGCFFVLLLCFFIVPGILYLVWADGQPVSTCPRCQTKDNMIPLASPEAQRFLAAEHAPPGHGQPPREERACPWCAEPILVAAKVCKHCGRDV